LSVAKCDALALRNELEMEKQRSASRERDIEQLEQCLNELKDNMGREYHNKCRDYDNLKNDFATLNAAKNELGAQLDTASMDMLGQGRQLHEAQLGN